MVGQGVEHAAEGTGTGGRADQVFQDEVPADKERHELPHRHVAVGVSRARGLGDPHAKLSVANACLEKYEAT